jgi:hypothetical protein
VGREEYNAVRHLLFKDFEKPNLEGNLYNILTEFDTPTKPVRLNK